jgi:hypothetical protein
MHEDETTEEQASPAEAFVPASEPEVVEAGSDTALPPPPPPPPAPPTGVGALSQTEKSDTERKALLANTLQGQVAGGARIESQGDFQAVVVRGHRTNHLLHFLVGVFTLGLWWIVWFFIAIFGGEKRQMINVDQFGNVLVQKV